MKSGITLKDNNIKVVKIESGSLDLLIIFENKSKSFVVKSQEPISKLIQEIDYLFDIPIQQQRIIIEGKELSLDNLQDTFADRNLLEGAYRVKLLFHSILKPSKCGIQTRIN